MLIITYIQKNKKNKVPKKMLNCKKMFYIYKKKLYVTYKMKKYDYTYRKGIS